MPITIQPPQPGDLITSSFMKQLIEQLQTHEARISALEGVVPGAGGNLAIINLSATDLSIGDELRIFGVNFGLPSENVVTFNGQNPTRQFKAGSSDTLLVLDVPPLSFLGDTQLFDVAVSDPRGFDKRQLTVRKPVQTVPSGTLLVGAPQFPSVDINVPASGFSNFTFGFTIEARANMEEIYNVVPTCTMGWATTLVTDMSGNSVSPQLPGGPSTPPWQIRIPKPADGQVASFATVFARLSIPSNASPAAGGNIGLTVASTRNPHGLVATPFSVNFPLNAPAPNPQTLTFGIAQVNGPQAQSTSDPIFALPTATTLPLNKVVFTVHNLTANVNYQVNLDWQGGNSNGWTASLGGSPQTPGWPFTVSAPNGPLIGPGDALVPVVVVGTATAKPATLILTVQKLPVTTPVTKSTDYGILNQQIKSPA